MMMGMLSKEVCLCVLCRRFTHIGHVCGTCTWMLDVPHTSLFRILLVKMEGRAGNSPSANFRSKENSHLFQSLMFYPEVVQYK